MGVSDEDTERRQSNEEPADHRPPAGQRLPPAQRTAHRPRLAAPVDPYLLAAGQEAGVDHVRNVLLRRRRGQGLIRRAEAPSGKTRKNMRIKSERNCVTQECSAERQRVERVEDQ